MHQMDLSVDVAAKLNFEMFSGGVSSLTEVQKQQAKSFASYSKNQRICLQVMILPQLNDMIRCPLECVDRALVQPPTAPNGWMMYCKTLHLLGSNNFFRFPVC